MCGNNSVVIRGYLSFQARNKPADGSSHLRNSSGQRDKTPSGGQKGPAKATAHSVKGAPPGKQHGSRSQSQSKIQSVTQAAVTVTNPNGNKKKNKKPHDLVVTINLVSEGEGSVNAPGSFRFYDLLFFELPLPLS